MEDIIDDVFNETKKAQSRIFSVIEISTGAFIGGALAGAYLLSHNFKVFGEPQKASVTWAISIVYTVILIGSLFYFPILDNIPNIVFTSATTGAFYGAANHYQQQNIDNYLSNGGTTNSWLRTIGISILFAIFMLAIIVGWTFLSDPTMNDSDKTYGDLNHGITYTENISESDADKIADGLIFSGYFGMDFQAFAYLDKKDEKYLIYITIMTDDHEDSEVVDYYQSVHDNVETSTTLDVSIHLVDEYIDNIKLTIDD